MSLCAYCHQRKGKRPCPALNGSICSHCCGEHRTVRLSCPADCAYLDSGSEYQQKRLAEQFMPLRRDFYRELEEAGGRPAAGLFNLIEAVTFSYFDGRHEGHDAELVSALQSLRRTFSPLHVPAGPIPVFAEHLKREYETFGKHNPGQITDPSTGPEMLDRIIRFVSSFSGTELQSKRFLGGLIGYIKLYHPQLAEYFRKKREPGHIILPGESFIPPPAEPHMHGSDCQHRHP